MDPKGKKDMVSEEVRMFEEEQRKASAVTQAKQCAWTKWNDIEPIIVEILNGNGTTGDIIPSSLYLWSLTKCDQPKIMGIYQFGPVLVV